MSRCAFVLLFALFGSGAGTVQACSCVDQSKSQIFQIKGAAHDAIFVGMVEITSIRFAIEVRDAHGVFSGLKFVTWDDYQSLIQDKGPKPFYETASRHLRVAGYRVVNAWKGQRNLDPHVATAIEWQACGIPFEVGQQVLLYADPPDYSGLAQANSCGRTTLAESAANDVDALNRLVPGATSKQSDRATAR
jgi:hypothetical protein